MAADRSTNWHQGAILSKQDFNKIRNNTSSDGFITISHDCDIASEMTVEPHIEFIPFTIVEDCNGNFQFGKNPRKLHFQIINNKKIVIIELLATEKISISKAEIIKFTPDKAFSLKTESIEILQSWLAARYKRHALPNSLVERLRPITEHLENNLKKQLNSILGVWIDYLPREEITSEIQYELWIYFVYCAEDEKARMNADELVNKVREKFKNLDNSAGNISLVSCETYSESEFTLSDMRSTLQYRYDYLSYRTNPPGPNL